MTDKHPGGRPTKYDPAFCDLVIEHGKAGKSKAWIAAEFDVCRQTLENWEAEHPEFLDAMARARLYSQRWWEDKGQDGMEKREFNASIWSRSMAARFPDDWTEKKGVEHSGELAYRKIEHEIIDPSNTDS